MTTADFLAFYPQFDGVYPDIVLDSYVSLANARFDEYGEDMEEARRLYTAHKLTLYAKTVPSRGEDVSAGSSYSSLASAGDGARVTSKRVENVAVTYSSGGGSSSAAGSGLEDLTETEYGLQLLGLIRRFAYSRYVP